MASNYTENYGLCQWEATDQVLRTEFNEDNAKVDAALKGLAEQDTTFAEILDRHETSLTQLGNCQFYLTSYVGSNAGGSAYRNTLTFPKQPMIVYVCDPSSQLAFLAIRPSSVGLFIAESLSWGSRSLSWFAGNATDQLNLNRTYQVLALLAADQ